MTLVLRTGLDAAAVDARLRPIVKAIDPGVPVYAVTRLDRQLADSRAVFSRRFPMILCAVFGAAALALTLIALHAICSHEVLTRQREFGIRIALGGSPESIRAIILRDALRLGTLGAGLGAGVAVLASRAMRSVLFGIGETDWRVYALAAAVVLAAALAASLAPALRAATVSPGAVMRGE